MKGQILDVYPEGEETFRACILEVMGEQMDLVRVVNLGTGETSLRGISECDSPIIKSIFDVDTI